MPSPPKITASPVERGISPIAGYYVAILIPRNRSASSSERQFLPRQHDKQQDADEVARTAGHHQNMPYGVEMSYAVIIHPEYQAECIASDAQQHPP